MYNTNNLITTGRDLPYNFSFSESRFEIFRFSQIKLSLLFGSILCLPKIGTFLIPFCIFCPLLRHNSSCKDYKVTNHNQWHSLQYEHSVKIFKKYDRWGYSEEEWKDCERQDYRNLVNEYLNKSQHPGFEGARVKVVKNRGELNSTNIAETDYLLGEFFILFIFNDLVQSR